DHHAPSDSHHASDNSNHEEKHTDQHDVPIKEAPLEMLIPFLAVSVMLIVLGLYSGEIVTNIIHFAIPAGII
ncbi:MAG: hypothetical protein HQK67_01430, partial [Desulfamplus sp.]|nr:hypothetical protein [Desulfamplus sp.]